MCFVDPVLHCDSCATVTLKENEFFQQRIKTLKQGCSTFLRMFSFSDIIAAICVNISFLRESLLLCRHLLTNVEQCQAGDCLTFRLTLNNARSSFDKHL